MICLGCACGIKNTCSKAGTLCNCDKNTAEWVFDEGYVAEKDRLPLTEVRLGDTGLDYEKGGYRIGALECQEYDV